MKKCCVKYNEDRFNFCPICGTRKIKLYTYGEKPSGCDRFIKSEFKKVFQKGEFYISGAIPEVYEVFNDNTVINSYQAVKVN